MSCQSYSSQMMSHFVSLLIVLVGSVLQSTDAVSCYQCNYTDSAVFGTSTCSEPFNATNIAKCSGPLCSWQFANYTAPTSMSLVHRDCLDNTRNITEMCALFTLFGTLYNYATFNYGDSCCYTTGPQEDEGTAFRLSLCICQKDNCNGDMPSAQAPPSVDPFTRPRTRRYTPPAATRRQQPLIKSQTAETPKLPAPNS